MQAAACSERAPLFSIHIRKRDELGGSNGRNRCSRKSAALCQIGPERSGHCFGLGQHDERNARHNPRAARKEYEAGREDNPTVRQRQPHIAQAWSQGQANPKQHGETHQGRDTADRNERCVGPQAAAPRVARE